MRITNKHEVKNYLANNRIAMIQKAHYTTHTLIQFVNNRLVDKRILEFNKEVHEIRDPYAPKQIGAEMLGYNQLATQKDLQRILKKSLVSRTSMTEVEAMKVINDVSTHLTSIEVERTLKNIQYIDNVLETSEVNIQKYEALVKKLPQRVSRKEVLERCILKGEELPANKRLAWLERNLERGASYNKKYTYKELNQLSRDLERYKTNRLDYETAIMENRQADRQGYGRINETKTWIWSTLEDTRHEELDGETIPLTEKFEVTNSQTGDVDYLLYPGDVANDHNNCSNICNCQCSYEINQN